jgi:hypothetical protein
MGIVFAPSDAPLPPPPTALAPPAERNAALLDTVDLGADSVLGHDPSHRSWEERLSAVGRLLDREQRPARDLCLIETGGGFVVQRLVAAHTQQGNRWTIATDEVTPDQLTLLADGPRPSKRRWW